MMRLVALLPTASPLGGICPACDTVMDESGCRLGEDLLSRDPGRTRGIARVVEVFCAGTPSLPIMECPAC